MSDPQIRISTEQSPPSSPSCVSECPPIECLETRKRSLSRQLTMYEVPRNIAWERRRRQFLHQEERKKREDNLTDEDLKELKGCIELGFGFNAENGQRLCTTIPALDLYFAVNRQFLTCPLPSPVSGGSAAPLPSPTPIAAASLTLPCSFERPPMSDSDSRKILSPGDDPQQVKTRLRHWAQAVACSVMQSPIRGGGMD